MPTQTLRRSEQSPIKSYEDAMARLNRAIEDGNTKEERKWSRIAVAAEARAKSEGLL